MYFGILIFALGLAVGSFLNVWMWRNRPHPNPSPLGLRLREPSGSERRGKGEGSAWHGRSYCPQCKKALRWYELIPLLAFALQLGRCRGCKKRVDWQYPAVELVTGILFVLAYYTIELSNYPIIKSSQLATIWYLLAVLVILFVYDLRFGLVPDRVVLPAIAVAALYAVILNLSAQAGAVKDPVLLGTGFLVSLGMTIAAIAVGSAFFAAQYYLSKGRWLGEGDIRIGALMGAMLGWPHVISGLVVSYMIGGAVGILLLVGGRKKFGQTVPLGTFLTLGTAIIFLYGEQIWKWYWHI